MRIVGRGGPAAVTHRAVAEEAGVPLAATTYYFASKDDLLEQALRHVAEREMARVEEAGARLRAEVGTAEDVAGVLETLVVQELGRDRLDLIAQYELCLESARRPALAEISRAWSDAYVRLLAPLLEVLGAARPGLDARLLVAALDGLTLEELADRRGVAGAPGFREPLARLLEALLPG